MRWLSTLIHRSIHQSVHRQSNGSEAFVGESLTFSSIQHRILEDLGSCRSRRLKTRNGAISLFHKRSHVSTRRWRVMSVLWTLDSIVQWLTTLSKARR